jgi:hypothetical protein
LEVFWTFWDLDEDPTAIETLDSGGDNILYYEFVKIQSETFQFDGNSLNQSFPVYDSPSSTGFSDSFLDSSNPLTLDDSSPVTFITRNILVTWEYPLVENATEFLSDETLRAFYLDTQRLKRATETLYYEPIVNVSYNTSGTVNTTTYNNFEETITAEQKTLLIGSETDLQNVTTIRLGSGSITSFPAPSYCVSGVVLEITSGDIIYDENTFTNPFLRKRTRGKDDIPNFTEACFMTADSGIVLYSTFPEVKYHADMYDGIRFNLVKV